jgi:site-specific DNA-methyltransferase (adenine-specific)
MKKYKTLLVDPPWSYRNKRTGGSMLSGSAQKYQTMSIEELCALRIDKITDKDCILFLWVTCPMNPEAFQLINSWKFRFKTKIYWRKIMSLGLGYWYRGQVEELWLCIRGKVKAFRCQKPNFLQTKALAHSQKPEEIYEWIEPYALEPKAELFARRRKPGWDCYGYDIDGKDMRNILE